MIVVPPPIVQPDPAWGTHRKVTMVPGRYDCYVVIRFIYRAGWELRVTKCEYVRTSVL